MRVGTKSLLSHQCHTHDGNLIICKILQTHLGIIFESLKLQLLMQLTSRQIDSVINLTPRTLTEHPILNPMKLGSEQGEVQIPMTGYVSALMGG